MWARLKEEKKTVAVCRAVIKALDKGLRERDDQIALLETELKTERQRAEHYENSYQWAMKQLDRANNRNSLFLEMVTATARR